MFNKSFDLTSFVADIPSVALRKSCWLSLVGSVNASLFSAADAISAKLIALGYEPDEFKTLTTREIKALVAGPETGAGKDAIKAAQKMYAIHAEWRDELKASTIVSTGRKADVTLGSISSTITMMCGPQKERSIADDAVPVLKSLGIEVTPEMITDAKRQRLSDDNAWATQRRARAGMTEYIIDNIFASNDKIYDDGHDHAYAMLDIEIKEYLANKLMAALNKAMSAGIKNVLYGRTGDSFVGAGDYIIAKNLIPQLMDAMSTTSEKKVVAKAKAPRKPKVAKSTVKRAPAPTTPTTTVTEVNGIKVTTA